MMAGLGQMMNAISSPTWSARGEPSRISVLDIAGLNYAEARYDLDRELFPDRIIVGSETWPTRSTATGGSSGRPERHRGLHLDGLGLLRRGRDRPPAVRDPGRQPGLRSPERTPGCSPGAATSTSPATAGPPRTSGKSSSASATNRTWRSGGPNTTARWTGTPWAWSDAIASWTWPGSAGEPVTVEVYSGADEVELLAQRPVPRPQAPATATGSARSSRRSTSRANCSPSPTPPAQKPAATSCGPPPGRYSSAPKPTGTPSPPTAPTSPTYLSPSRPNGRHLLHPRRPAGADRSHRPGRPARLRQRRPRNRGTIRRDRTPHLRRPGPRRAPPRRPGQDPADRHRTRVRASRDRDHRRMTAGRSSSRAAEESLTPSVRDDASEFCATERSP